MLESAGGDRQASSLDGHGLVRIADAGWRGAWSGHSSRFGRGLCAAGDRFRRGVTSACSSSAGGVVGAIERTAAPGDWRRTWRARDRASDRAIQIGRIWHCGNAGRWRRICRRGPAGVADRRGVRPGGKRHSRLEGLTERDGRRCRRLHRRTGRSARGFNHAPRAYGRRRPRMTTSVREPRRDDVLGVPRDTVAIASRAQFACVLEASAPKPGNVSPGRPFNECATKTRGDAEAIARPSRRRPTAARRHDFHGRRATARRPAPTPTRHLLFWPLARAAVRCWTPRAPERGDRLQSASRSRLVLSETTGECEPRIARSGSPAGGLAMRGAGCRDGADDHVARAMRLAADRDGNRA